MGCFSWMYADTNNLKNLKIGSIGYIACPDGTFIKEDNYEGYGEFNGQDIYELVVDWNRPYLKDIFNKRKISQSKATQLSFMTNEFIALTMESDKNAQEYINQNINKESYLRKEWKRILGIYLACYDEDNAALPFPIKITRKTRLSYNELPPSDGDANQGFY